MRFFVALALVLLLTPTADAGWLFGRWRRPAPAPAQRRAVAAPVRAVAAPLPQTATVNDEPYAIPEIRSEPRLNAPPVPATPAYNQAPMAPARRAAPATPQPVIEAP